MGLTAASTSGTSAAGRCPRYFRGTPARSSAPSSRTRVTCWRPQAGMARPGSGTQPPGSPWRSRLVISSDSRRTTAGWPSGTAGRSASAKRRRGDECRTLHPGMLGNRTERRDATVVFCADFSPDGRLVATSDGDGVRLWEADTGRELAHLKAGALRDRALSPRRAEPHQLQQVGLVPLADPPRSGRGAGCNPHRAARAAARSCPAGR